MLLSCCFIVLFLLFYDEGVNPMALNLTRAATFPDNKFGNDEF